MKKRFLTAQLLEVRLSILNQSYFIFNKYYLPLAIKEKIKVKNICVSKSLNYPINFKSIIRSSHTKCEW